MNFEALPLSAITRISPLNPRQDMESDVSSLAATIAACGLIDPLVVWPRPDSDDEFEVLSGGRRWRALQSLKAEGKHGPNVLGGFNIPVEIHKGDEASAIRVALAAAVTPRPQHPVDEYEAFAKLVDAGMSVAQIARDFGETEKRVNQRLALAGLSPRVRELWRAGKIGAEAAAAFTVGSAEAQEALLDQCGDDRHRIDNPIVIRRALRGDAMPENEPVSRFILSDAARVQAYVEAGGRVAGDLFTAGALRDAPIAEKVAAELLRAEAERVAQEEGWARAVIEDDGAWGYENEPELTEEEEARLDEIAAAIDADPASADADALLAEQEKIMLDAILREWSAEERAAHGVFAGLDSQGKIYLSRGVALPDASAESAGQQSAETKPGEAAPQASPGESGEHTDEAAPAGAPFAAPGKALRAVIDETATKALAETLRRRPDIAIAMAVAALGCCYDVAGVALRPVAAWAIGAEEANGLLRAISGERFENALAACAAAPTGDLTVAFARLMALAVDTQSASLSTIAALIGAAGTRGADMTGALYDALDRRSYFEAIGKGRALDAIGAMIGEGEAKTHRNKPKDKVAEAAAHIALDRQFLPAPFANWAAVAAAPHAAADAIHADDERPIDATPLAAAMAGAIAADEAAKSDEARALDAKIDEVASAFAAPLLAPFLRQRVHFGNEALHAGQVKAGELYAAYADFIGDRTPLTQRAFGEAIAAIGVGKKRSKTGWQYLNIALKGAPASDAKERDAA
ncbi:ParB N-terminal domain-containing protein [Methylocystis parvus]|uniref:ParB/RepB/Spo0J family partition protein n=1 Tax=Methylocystis parvus TaxID=134 RepID=UPI003C75EE13